MSQSDGEENNEKYFEKKLNFDKKFDEDLSFKDNQISSAVNLF